MRVPTVAKTIVAGVVAVIGVVVPILGQDDVLTTTDIVQMALGILTAFGVYVVPNAPQVAEPGSVRRDPNTGTEYTV